MMGWVPGCDRDAGPLGVISSAIDGQAYKVWPVRPTVGTGKLFKEGGCFYQAWITS